MRRGNGRHYKREAAAAAPRSDTAPLTRAPERSSHLPHLRAAAKGGARFSDGYFGKKRHRGVALSSPFLAAARQVSTALAPGGAAPRGRTSPCCSPAARRPRAPLTPPTSARPRPPPSRGHRRRPGCVGRPERPMGAEPAGQGPSRGGAGLCLPAGGLGPARLNSPKREQSPPRQNPTRSSEAPPADALSPYRPTADPCQPCSPAPPSRSICPVPFPSPSAQTNHSC